MLFTALLHPEILSTLARTGHGSLVLIADGNYPFSTESPVTAQKVFLNLRPGMVTATEVLKVLNETIPIEAAMVMEAPPEQAAIHDEFRAILPAEAAITRQKRLAFYEEVKLPATALVIATGEERRFANLLLTIGVIKSKPINI